MACITGYQTPYVILKIYESGYSISYQIACALSEDIDHPANSRSLVRVFAGHSVGSQGSNTSSGG